MSNHIRWPALVVAGLIFAACTTAATPAPTSPRGTAPVTDGTLPKPELTSLRIAANVQEPAQFTPALADVAGIYEKYGIEVTFTNFNDDGQALQALLAGQVDMASVAASGIMNSLLSDTPAKSLTMQKVKVNDGLFCQQDVKTAADVKGKLVAVSTLGSTGHASALLAIEGLKMTDKDVTMQPIGGEATRIAAMKGGSVACAPIDMILEADMKALGFNLLIDLSEADLPYPATGLAALDTFLTKNPNTALVVVAANLEAHNMMWADPDKAAGYWAEYGQVDKAKALELVNGFTAIGNRSLRFTAGAFEFAQKVTAIVQPAIMSVDVKDAMDLSYLQKLEDIGFYKKIGNPLP